MKIMLFTIMNVTILIAGVMGAVWVWRDGQKRRDPWALTWAVATMLVVLIALPAYLLRARVRKVSQQ
jgi:hypothetical protein